MAESHRIQATVVRWPGKLVQSIISITKLVFCSLFSSTICRQLSPSWRHAATQEGEHFHHTSTSVLLRRHWCIEPTTWWDVMWSHVTSRHDLTQHHRMDIVKDETLPMVQAISFLGLLFTIIRSCCTFTHHVVRTNESIPLSLHFVTYPPNRHSNHCEN